VVKPALYLALALTTSPVTAQTVIQVTTEDWPPFNYTAANGEIVGLATTKVRQLFEQNDMPYQISIYPWARAYHLASTQANTAIYSIVRTPEREALFQWICPLHQGSQMYFYHLSSRKDIKITTLKEAKKYKTAVSRNEFDHQFLLNNGFLNNVHFEIASNDQTNLKKLLNNRVDLVLETEYAINEYLTRNNHAKKSLSKTLAIDPSLHGQNCLAFGLKTEKTIVEKLRNTLKQLNTPVKVK
jgi:polar amino acid transport system substrate-binding protein